VVAGGSVAVDGDISSRGPKSGRRRGGGCVAGGEWRLASQEGRGARELEEGEPFEVRGS